MLEHRKRQAGKEDTLGLKAYITSHRFASLSNILSILLCIVYPRED